MYIRLAAAFIIIDGVRTCMHIVLARNAKKNIIKINTLLLLYDLYATGSWEQYYLYHLNPYYISLHARRSIALLLLLSLLYYYY